MNLFLLIPYAVLGMVLIWALYLIFKARSNYQSVNTYHLDSIPALFTTIGVFGTFLGIVLGLQEFDTNNIEGSIPLLLDGLKVSFWSSIIGIIFSIVSSKFIEGIQFRYEKRHPESNDEISILQIIAQRLDNLAKSISSDSDSSLNTQLVKLRTTVGDHLTDISKLSKISTVNIESIKKGIVDDGETSLLSQIQRLRDEQKELGQKTHNEVVEIHGTLRENGRLMVDKMDDFAELLEKSNTEALVKAIENVIGGFNERLNELIERLVKENFEELNKSVQALNEWQVENKEQVERLIIQYKDAADSIDETATSLGSIAESTEQLVGDGGRLEIMIHELEAVISEENQLVEAIESMNRSAELLDDSTSNLSEWMDNHIDFVSQVETLIKSLQEIEELRNNTDGFFNDIKKKMEEGVSIIHNGNDSLMQEVNEIESSFRERMAESFQSLDKVLQAMVTGYAERMNGVR